MKPRCSVFVFRSSTRPKKSLPLPPFFRPELHELQTCSWGVSKIGRVAQRVDAAAGYVYSEFDTTIFSLTVIPILGWFKLLPTFGGCVITASTAAFDPKEACCVELCCVVLCCVVLCCVFCCVALCCVMCCTC